MRIINLAILIVLVASVSTAFPAAATAQTTKPPNKLALEDEEKPLSVWMEKKMEYTQDILRGLVHGDLDFVAERAEQMRVVAQVEGWIRGKKPGYRAHLQVFQFANSEILRQSRANNLEGTTMAFQQLTVSCVSCHRILRETNGHGEDTVGQPKSAD